MGNSAATCTTVTGEILLSMDNSLLAQLACMLLVPAGAVPLFLHSQVARQFEPIRSRLRCQGPIRREKAGGAGAHWELSYVLNKHSLVMSAAGCLYDMVNIIDCQTKENAITSFSLGIAIVLHNTLYSFLI